MIDTHIQNDWNRVHLKNKKNCNMQLSQGGADYKSCTLVTDEARQDNNAVDERLLQPSDHHQPPPDRY